MASVALSRMHEHLHSTLKANSCYRCDLSHSIWIYLTVSGYLIPMRIMETDSIASVKLRIQISQGFSVTKQKLVFDGRELARNDSCVGDYGVTDGNVLHLVLRLSDLKALTVWTTCGKTFEFYLERNRNVSYVKQQIQAKWTGFVDLKDQELLFDGEALEDQRIIDDICKEDDVVIHLLVRKYAKVSARPVEKDVVKLSIEALCPSEKGDNLEGEYQSGALSLRQNVLDKKQLCADFLLEPLTINSTMKLPLVVESLIKSTYGGLEQGRKPIRSAEGSGGTYLMQDSSGLNSISVFKPTDEEPLAVNNPRGLPASLDGEGLKKGTRVGQGALREVAAYILDHPLKGPLQSCDDARGFAGVPPTVMVWCLHEAFNHPHGFEHTISHVKTGSLQMFIKNMGSCDDMGPRSFPVSEVHKISVLDIRLANADRHAGNILIGKNSEDGQLVLVPIDHGYCLPENFEDCTFEWLYWPQSHEPYSPETIDYIKSLDAEEDIRLLKLHGWDLPPKSARILSISTMLLKKGAERGFTPFTIGSIMCRETMKKKSSIEKMIEEAEETTLPGSSEAAFFESVAMIMDYHLHKLTK